MVGRMEGQSVVLRAEKGKLRLTIDDEEGGEKQEMVYDVSAGEEKTNGSIDTLQKEKTDGQDREAEGREANNRGQQEKAEGIGSYSRGEMPGGAVGVDGETETRGSVSGAGSSVERLEPVAGRAMGDCSPWHPRIPVAEKTVALNFASCNCEKKRRSSKGLERRFVRLQKIPVKPGERNYTENKV